MAAATKTTTNPLEGVGDLTSLINLFKGQTTTSGTSTEGVNALLQNILSGTQGLSAVSSGAKTAGGYNSSAQTLLTNDFLTSAAAKAATSQTTQTKKAPIGGKDILTAAALFGGKSLLGPTLKAGAKKLGVGSLDDIGQKLAGSIFGGASGTGASMALGSTPGDAFMTGGTFGDAFMPDMEGLFSGVEALDLASSAGDVASLAEFGDSFDAFDAFGDAVSTGADLASGVDAASGGIPWFTILNLASNGQAGEFVGNMVGDFGSLWDNTVGTIFGDIFGSL